MYSSGSDLFLVERLVQNSEQTYHFFDELSFHLVVLHRVHEGRGQTLIGFRSSLKRQEILEEPS